MTDPRHNKNIDPLAVQREEGASADLRNLKTRRTFLQAAGLGAAALAAHGVTYGAENPFRVSKISKRLRRKRRRAGNPFRIERSVSVLSVMASASSERLLDSRTTPMSKWWR
jgi:hypothetical protein